MSQSSLTAIKKGRVAPFKVGVRQEVIVSDLRAQIVGGAFGPGHRLPSRIEIERQFGASTVTVQRALETLKRDGFVIASRGDGTYVSAHPPHLSRIAVVFPSAPDRKDWSRFWAVFSREATALQDDSTFQLPLYYGVDEHHDSEDYLRLVADVRAHRVAGLIFASPPFLYHDTPLLSEPNLPRVSFSGLANTNIPAIAIQSWSLIERALDRFRAQGRKRVAFIMAPSTTYTDPQLLEAARARGLQTYPRFCHRVHRSLPATARGIAQLMFHRGQNEIPDALLIGDDNLVEQVTLGVADARAGAQVSIVAHCNFPHPPDAATPTTYLGFDARQILALCLQSLQMQRDGQRPPPLTRVAAQFENELTDFGLNRAFANEAHAKI